MGVFEDSDHSVCPSCLAANLLQEIKIQRCVECNRIMCTHFSSTIDAAKCQECLHDITLLKETVEKEYVRTDDEGNVTSTYKKKAKRVRLEGLNWLFAQRKIVSLSDDELELSIEYHREILAGMLDERETRKNAFMHRYANAPLPSSITGESTETITVKKTTKSIKSKKEDMTADAIMKSLLASGMTPQQIMAMIGGK